MSSTWADPRHQGAGTWTHTVPHHQLRLTLLGTVLLCLAMAVAFLGFLAAGHRVMCAVNKTTAGHGALSYCPNYRAPEPSR